MSRTLLDIAVKVMLAVALTSACSACAHSPLPEPVVRTVEIKVPVPVTCVPASLPDPAAYVDTDEALKAAAGPEGRFQLLAAGRIQRNARLSRVEPVIAACRSAVP